MSVINAADLTGFEPRFGPRKAGALVGDAMRKRRWDFEATALYAYGPAALPVPTPEQAELAQWQERLERWCKARAAGESPV
jgi:hypothetical protein